MSIKRVLVTLMVALMALGMFSTAHAAETSAEATIDVMSNYVWRGVKLSSEVVIQPGVSLSYGALSLGLWSNYDADLAELNETDYTVSYSTAVGPASLDLGYIYYGLDGVNDTQELFAAVGFDTILSPSIELYYDFDEGDGAFLVIGCGHSIGISDKMSVDLGAAISYNLSNEVMGDFDDFYNVDLSVSLPIALNDNISITPMIAYTAALSNDAEAVMEAVAIDGDTEVFYGGVSLAIGF